MNWKINTHPENNTKFNLGIDFSPVDENLTAFFESLPLPELPELLRGVLDGTGFGNEWASYKPYNEMDEEDHENTPEIAEGEVLISHEVFDQTILDEMIASYIVYEYAQKTLEYYANNPDVQTSYTKWLNFMKEFRSYNPERYAGYHADWTEEMTKYCRLLEQKFK